MQQNTPQFPGMTLLIQPLRIFLLLENRVQHLNYLLVPFRLQNKVKMLYCRKPISPINNNKLSKLNKLEHRPSTQVLLPLLKQQLEQWLLTCSQPNKNLRKF